MSRLSIYRDDALLGEHPLAGGVIALGRHPENDIVLDDRTLSRFHARVERRGERFVVVDLGAQNGVHVNGNRVVGELDLTAGDRIRLGRYIAVFEPSPPRARNDDGRPLDAPISDVREPSSPSGVFQPTSASVAAAARRAPALVVFFDGREVGRHSLERGELVIGRSKMCDVVISLAGLSRRHARVSASDDGRYVVEDLGSQNGTWVNHERIEQSRPLSHGDIVNFSDYGVMFSSDDSLVGSTESEAVKAPVPHATQVPMHAQQTARLPSLPSLTSEPGTPEPNDVSLGDGSSFLEDAFDDVGPPTGSMPSLQGGLSDGGSLDLSLSSERPSARDEDLEAAIAFEAEAAHEMVSSIMEETKTSVQRYEAVTDDRAWPNERDLLGSFIRIEDDRDTTLDLFLDGSPYTQMPLTAAVTRMGSDARCELSMPRASGLKSWHVTFLHVGSSLVAYRAHAQAEFQRDGVEVHMAVLKDGDELDLGRVRVVVRRR